MAEKLITISIRKYLSKQPRTKRARRAARYIRERASHYMKIDGSDVTISKELNNRIVKYYSRRMVPVKLRARIENGKAALEEFSVAKPGEQKEERKESPSKKQEGKKADAKANAEPPKKAEDAAGKGRK